MTQQLPPGGPPPQPRPGMPPQPYMGQAPQSHPPAAWGASPPQAPTAQPPDYDPHNPVNQYPPTSSPLVVSGTPPLQQRLPSQPPLAQTQQAPTTPCQQPQFPTQAQMAQPQMPVQGPFAQPIAQQLPPTVTTPPPLAQQPAPVQQSQQGAMGKSIPQLLKEFGKKPGCEKFAADGKKIDLMTEYLWLRQLTPNLPFETFLELFQALADHDEVNLKHPQDAIYYLLPRTKKAADEKQTHHWSAKEVSEFVSLYIDMIREAETTGQPIPMDFNTFIRSLQAPFLAGDFKEPEPPRSGLPGQQQLPFEDGAGSGTATGTRKPRAARAPAAPQILRPTTAQQRVLLTLADGRQFRGVVATVHPPDPATQFPGSFDLQLDGGEFFSGCYTEQLEVITDPLPSQPLTADGNPSQVIGQVVIYIPKSEYPRVCEALTLTTAMGNVALGDTIYTYAVGFQDGLEAAIEIVNGESGPYVDARLSNVPTNLVLAELPPRNRIEGKYTFQTPGGIYEVEVKPRE